MALAGHGSIASLQLVRYAGPLSIRAGGTPERAEMSGLAEPAA
jgi:hypothetical protein